MKNLFFAASLFLLFPFQETNAQVQQNIVLEHFTNTRCGICASRNPGLHANVNNHPGIIRLTVHPSRPYSSCQLHRHNPTANDDRTNYYGILGGTPRIVIQGSVVSASTNYGDASIFDAYENKMTPFDVRSEILKRDQDSLVAQITIKATESHSYTSLLLYAPAVEDTLFFEGPNREKVHYNVLRKVLLNQEINNLPENGDSISLIVRTDQNAVWEPDAMQVLAMLQESGSKEMIQAATSNNMMMMEEEEEEEEEEEDSTASINYLNPDDLSIYPNPSSGLMTIELSRNENGKLVIYSTTGVQLLATEVKSTATVDISAFPSGLYFVHLSNNKGSVVKRIWKE